MASKARLFLSNIKKTMPSLSMIIKSQSRKKSRAWTPRTCVLTASKCSIRKTRRKRRTLALCANGPATGLQTVLKTKTLTPSVSGVAKWGIARVNAGHGCRKARKTKGSSRRELNG